ncbi:MAG: DUF5678 domain-containing protein [Blastocatellia bacterium]
MLEELRSRLDHVPAATGASMNGAANGDFQWPDPAPNNAWLNEHAGEYQGEWVALYDGQLLAHGNDSKALVDAVKQSGAPIPLILFIPPEPPTGVVPFVGWL